MRVVAIENRLTEYHTLDVKFTQNELELFNSGRYVMRIFPEETGYIISQKNIDGQRVIDIILDVMGTTLQELKPYDRIKRKVTARMFISVYLRMLTKLTYAQIGKIINRDHALVMYMLKRFPNEMKYQDISVIKDRIDSALEQENII